MHKVTQSPLVPYRITICGLAELCQHEAAGVSHVLTILDPGHPDPQDFTLYAPHRRTIWRYHDIINPADGMTPPEPGDVRAILDFGREQRDSGIDHLLVHCHMGISRSTATVAILLAQHNPGREAEAFAHIRTIRPHSWPNSRMIAFADDQLGRDGALITALTAHHDVVAHAFPDLARLLLEGERAGEVPADIR